MNLLPLSRRIAISIALSAVVTGTANAEIYKWTDAQGNTHYSQTPPQVADGKADNVENIVDDIEMSTGKLGNKSASTEVATKDDDEMAQARAEGKKNVIKHKNYCHQQQTALKQLVANPVIRWKSGDEERVLTAKERQAKIKEFGGNIKELCNEDVLAAKSKIDIN